jgi:tetratricopeptide (TPR) repeat protein
MASKKTSIAENVQLYLDNLDWHAAIAEMEKLFVIDQDPLIRVRIGDARRKLNRISEAIKDYLYAADLFAERGFVGKALAQYNLALKLDSSNEYARSKSEKLRSCRTSITTFKRAPLEYRMPLLQADFNSDVQYAHRTALTGTLDRQ